MNDDSKKLVLARRARFVAAALAGVAVACGKEQAQPQPCLSQVYVPPDAEPMPCLSPVYVPPPDADTTTDDAGPVDAGGGATEPDAAKPMPCLSPRPNPTQPPRPCLSVAPPTRPLAPKQQ